MTTQISPRIVCALSLFLAVGALWCFPSEAAEREETNTARKTAASLQSYRSRRLQVYSDLQGVEARQIMARLERTLTHAEKYWGQELPGQIECYLIDDLEKLPDSALPHPLARVLVGGVGGATLSYPSRSGKTTRNLPVVFASTKPGVAEHEVVHAYCAQTLGSTGPNWYKEGMAEIVVLGATRESGVQCTVDQIQQLRENHRTSIHEVLTAGHSARRITDSLRAMLEDPKNRNRLVPATDWRQQDTDNVRLVRREYLHSWALCYLLLNNTNYSARFQMLGRKYLTDHIDEFADFFASVQREIAFEYAFFLQHIDVGYRVDLCSWDWNSRFKLLIPGETVAPRIAAGKGYQASGLSVLAGHQYSYSAEGTWSTATDAVPIEADGGENDRGRLVGVIMNDFQLGLPFPLGVRGTFHAPHGGRLYLRCNDAWHEVHDNHGDIVIRIDCH